MLIFVDQVTERLRYTFDFVFKQHGFEYEFTNDRSVFSTATEVRLNYSEFPFEGVSQLIPSTLLFSEEIATNLTIKQATWNGCESFSIDEVCDPFASIFYVISRYEEYVIQKRDKHDRFQAVDSLLFQFGWLRQQVVERWVEAIFKAYLPTKFDQLKGTQLVTVIPSFDIDNTYAFKWKRGWRKWLSIAKDTASRNQSRLQLRKEVNKGSQTDPYDTYKRIEEISKTFLNTRIFWLLGDYGEYDRNISWRDSRHQRLIRLMKQVAKIGLHPSYGSNYSDKKLFEERNRINQITATTIIESRQHFLKVSLPHTYRRLIAEGFKKDYSMGFADQPGFRLGTAHPVYFFDLELNQATDYTLIPFVYMDGTFNEYMNCSIEESKQIVQDLANEVKQFGGVFCFIWHNETIGDTGKWIGWSAVLDYTLTLFDDESTSSVS